MDSLRISDADRAAAVDLLGEQYAEGRLSRDELDERSDAVWSAKTRGDLAPVFVDLPVRSPAQPPAETVSLSPRSGFPVRVMAPFLFLVIALTVVTHLPFVLFALVLWFVLSRRYGVHRPPWSHHQHHGPRRQMP
jgi:hypothetical protein